jgi:1-acyl-sn-glycerol-3-phosphate acyltransferase
MGIIIELIKKKLKIILTPLPHLRFLPRLVLRLMLLAFGDLIQVEGEKNLKGLKDPVVFAFNHNTEFETLLVAWYLIFARAGRTISFIIDWMFQFIPIVGWMFRQIKPVYVYNKKARFKAIDKLRKKNIRLPVYDECIYRLGQNRSIGIFPEGTRNRNPKMLRKARNGVGLIVLKANIPVIPTGIDFPKRLIKGKIPKLGCILMRIGKPLDFSHEHHIFRQMNQNRGLSTLEISRVTIYLSSYITFKIMQQISLLCGKSYPFKPAEKPSLLKYVNL